MIMDFESSNWREDERASIPFWSSVVEDMRAHIPPSSRPQTRRGWAAMGCRIALESAGFRAVLTYRLGHAARARMGAPGKLLSGSLHWFGRHWYGCSLPSTARIYGGLILPHPHGIVIGPDVVLGPRAWLFQNVTLGGAPGKSGMPRIGADARIYAGAVVSGPVALGDNVVVGANAVVHKDMPGGSVARSTTSVEARRLPPNPDK